MYSCSKCGETLLEEGVWFLKDENNKTNYYCLDHWRKEVEKRGDIEFSNKEKTKIKLVE